MLDKLSKKILQYMNEQPQPSDVYYNFDEDLDEVAEAVASDSESVRSAVRYLHERKLIKFAYYNDSDIAACFYLDHKGLHYKEFNQLEGALERTPVWLCFRHSRFCAGKSHNIVAFMSTSPTKAPTINQKGHRNPFSGSSSTPFTSFLFALAPPRRCGRILAGKGGEANGCVRCYGIALFV